MLPVGAAAIIDHLSQKDKIDMKHRKSLTETFDSRTIIAQRLNLDNKDFKRDIEPMETSDYSFYHHSGIKHHRYTDSSEFKAHLPPRTHKNVRYKFWGPGCLHPTQKHKRPTDKEIMELLYRLQITVSPPRLPEDTRKCMFCQGKIFIQ
ncbi:hypothetical protein NQ314_015564 [Rhamnusium bicolor]|uniref:Uncharacterized protein n=1 Tax=Rhamnusium bicolor TaxID=1586634 RepID=A0AAV8WXQ0_9CUCU|nr:hypothetical protein NQ314_015564 [Rhamnusium bicolor]